MKFLSILVPAVAVIVPALALEDCSSSCINTAVSATQCLSSNIECVCDSSLFLETIFECSLDCGADEDDAIDTAEDYCGALYKRSAAPLSADTADIAARADGAHRLALRQAMTAIHKIRGELKRTSGREARMALFRKLRRARGKLNKLWGDGKKHKGYGRKLNGPPPKAHPGKPHPPTTTPTTEPSGPTQTVLP